MRIFLTILCCGEFPGKINWTARINTMLEQLRTWRSNIFPHLVHLRRESLYMRTATTMFFILSRKLIILHAIIRMGEVSTLLTLDPLELSSLEIILEMMMILTCH